ncbi:hypothetical protein C3B59_06245 [Cryobacterium zongtaii]|uniref:GtrA-like protein domain-containing protein n=1 Tax=Cryobacterium zongtaii TaxID=1259217 RepID=A0A2S3ZK46_9MICO|nr:hypothetical protein [Cryobacterium zongtaii]POH68432.1 hypothetical protein C3B59_06245 [Cryobacterium zongtaii]
MITRIKASWAAFVEKRPAIAQFIVFTVLSSGMTVLQFIMMPVIKWIFGMTSLVDTGFQMLPVGTNFDGSTYYLFDYAAGALPLGGGGLAYFLAVQITLAIAQVINFFAQRNITFKSNSSPWVAAFWYTAAYIVISFGAAALQGLYKAPVYELLISTWGLGASGEALADVITMLINAIISFWVFFPIFKVIFKREPELEDGATGAARHVEIGSAQR